MSAVAAAFLVVLAFGRPALAGEFRVAPIRLDFDKDVKTSVVTVSNEGADAINLQMKAFEWTQDAEGKDVYTETNDLIFFPRLMKLKKGEERTLRAGTRVSAVAREKTYRLFVEEIPAPAKSDGVNIRIALRFGIPVFIKPFKEESGVVIESIGASGGAVNAVVRNTGNVHVMISSVTLRGVDSSGKELFAQQLGGWYLLNGASRQYSTAIPVESCVALARLDAEVSTDGTNLSGTLPASAASCRP
jgi:fimbrial chaperone protein